MVRAGVAKHPGDWIHGGYAEIQTPRQRYGVINRQKLTELLGLKDRHQLSEYHHRWVEQVLSSGLNQREAKWTESIAVGDENFVTRTKAKLGAMAIGRRVVENREGFELKEPQLAYNDVFSPKKGLLRPINTYFWQVF
jgi:hypothetical protein